MYGCLPQALKILLNEIMIRELFSKHDFLMIRHFQKLAVFEIQNSFKTAAISDHVAHDSSKMAQTRLRTAVKF